MANSFGATSKTPSHERLRMSNSLTSVFIDVLALSGVQIAGTDVKKRLIVWLSEKDQSKVGAGTVGFNLCDMPWDLQTFETDKNFLLQSITDAKRRVGWQRLGYTPAEELLFPCLDKFSVLLSELKSTNVRPEILVDWLAEAEGSDPVLCGFPICPKHDTLLTVFGCHICNNDQKERIK